MVKSTRKKSPAKLKAKAAAPDKPAAPKLIPAVGYLRKSTDGETKGGKIRQEKSIPQQKRETTELAKDEYEILDWYADPGKSGTRMDRPDFQRMLTRARERGDFRAILCDNIDRFSRGEIGDVQAVARDLKRAGVRWIVTAAQGVYNLGHNNDIGAELKFVVAVWASHEYSRQLSRRIALAMRNRANEGKRAAAAPYGLEHDGKGGLKLGKKKEREIVLRVFRWFAVELKSINWISGELNRLKVPARRGNRWYVAAISDMLRRRAYVGDLVFNAKKSGKFFFINAKGEVVETSERTCSKYMKNAEGLIVHKGVYPALVPLDLFDKAQKRLDSFATNASHRPRAEGFSLTGVLWCGHCHRPMYGCRPGGKNNPRDYRVYRCSANSTIGKDTCIGTLEVHEERILPKIIDILREEIGDLGAMLTDPPESIVSGRARRKDQRQEDRSERDALARKIDTYQERILDIEDRETRQAMDRKIATLRVELAELEQQLLAEPEKVNGFTRDELQALSKFWDEFEKRAVRVPIKGKINPLAALCQDPDDPEQVVLLDPRVVNETLIALGIKVTLYWTTRKVKIKTGPNKGKERDRHFLTKGRLQGGKFGKKGCIFPITSACRDSRLYAAVSSDLLGRIDRVFDGEGL